MADLIAQGEEAKDQWRRTLPPGELTLGRDPARSMLAANWDKKISGLHAALEWQGDQLRVRRLPEARNPIFFGGVEVGEFTVGVGEQFVIGKTVFSVQPSERVQATEYTCSAQELRQHRYVDADERLDALAALPGLIRLSPSDQQLEAQVVDVLLRGIPRAKSAAVICQRLGSAEVEVRAVRARGLGGAPAPPSRKLVADALSRRRQSVLHLWEADNAAGYTAAAGYDWAACVPMLDDLSAGWGLYVAGSLAQDQIQPDGPSREELLKSDLKFAELTAQLFGALRQVRDLQGREALLARFLSRPVREALASRDINDALKPTETEVTVLFCDLRGSSHLAEEGAADLQALWRRIGAALDIMGSCIIDQDGVIGDFQGDAAMGFWGWPFPAADQAVRAARAALNIHRRFMQAAQQREHPLAGFACGIGLASGRAIAGRLGTLDQFKVDVFGPVVNLASRLESLTKLFAVPILLDPRTTELLASGTALHGTRCRRVACVRPLGMSKALQVHGLLPAVGDPGSLSETDSLDYEAALTAFQDGRWPDARRLLTRLPHDGAARALMAFMERHPLGPPKEWEGTVEQERK